MIELEVSADSETGVKYFGDGVIVSTPSGSTAYNVSAGEADPFFNLFIRQPLPSGSFLPGQMEALVDIRNLLAQGYIPVIGRDGHTLYLVQSARSIRGGVAFNF